MYSFNKLPRFRNMSLRSRLLMYFVIFFIIPTLIICIVSYTISFQIIKEKAIEFSAQTMDQISDEIDGRLVEAYRTSNIIANDPFIQEPLRRPLEMDTAKRFSTELTIDSRMNFITSYAGDIFGFYVIGANGGRYKSNYCSIVNKDMISEEWYKEIVNSQGPVWFGTHKDSFVVHTAEQNFISIGIKIIDKATGRVSGVVLIDILESNLKKTFSKAKFGMTSNLFIVDNRGSIILSQVGVTTYPNNQTNGTIKKVMGKDIYYYNSNTEGRSLVIYKTSALTGWKTVSVIPVKELSSGSSRLGLVIGLLLIFICIFTLIAAWYTAGSIANPITKLMILMKKVDEGDLSVSMNVKYNDEIGRLGNSFNIMIKNVGNLMNRVYFEQKELRKAELKALQAQINPHFLYNTLDSIVWMARSNKNEEVIKMVTALTRLFRIGLSRGRDIITIKEEIEHVNNYLIIQGIRYQNKMQYRIEAEESLFNYKTLKLILQPIVENAIYHGIKEKRGQGLVTIKVYEESEDIIFLVEDNGIGMTTEQLDALKNTLLDSEGEKTDSYGVRNVDERLKIFFGPSYGLKFESEYNVGTKVMIHIPKVMEVESLVKSSIS